MPTTFDADTVFDADTFKQNKARLNAAFRDLRTQGILAKQNYACCQTCGFADLDKEFELLARRGQEVKGGVFYHAQDADSLTDQGRCHLAYSGYVASEDASSAAHYDAAVFIGRIACDALRRRGVKVEWDGSVRTRIAIDLTVPAADREADCA